MFELKLFAKYFKEQSTITYQDNKGCPGALAMKAQLNIRNEDVFMFGANVAIFNGGWYDIKGGHLISGKEGYGVDNFDKDYAKAKEAGFDDTLIRTLTLKERII